MNGCPQVPESTRRHPVWVALGELYLDVELQEGDFRRIAHVLGNSGFTWAEIQQINYDEVAPVLWQNMLSMVGEWAGWDDTLLIAEITARYRGVHQRLFGSRKLWQRVIDYFTDDWLTRIAAHLP